MKKKEELFIDELKKNIPSFILCDIDKLKIPNSGLYENTDRQIKGSRVVNSISSTSVRFYKPISKF